MADPQADAKIEDLNEAQDQGGIDIDASENLDGEPGFQERRAPGVANKYKRSIYGLPVSVQVVIGTARPTIAELLKLKKDSLLELEARIEDPVELCIDNRVLARGELVETDAALGTIGVRLTEIVDISEDILP